jgi:hypothetical protein
MDKDVRNRIQKATQSARALLEREFAEQLGGVFDIRVDGTIATLPGSHLDAEQRVLRTKLVAAVEHRQSSVASRQPKTEDRRPATATPRAWLSSCARPPSRCSTASWP